MSIEQELEYHFQECVVITGSNYLDLSNIASGYSLFINGIIVPSSEALYQACRFPDSFEIQSWILNTQSAVEAKKISRQYIIYTRHDWDNVRIDIMRWCIMIKMIQNFSTFSRILLGTRNMSIVEYSEEDSFWGAKPLNSSILRGNNVMGKLLMELRYLISQETWSELTPVLGIPGRSERKVGIRS